MSSKQKKTLTMVLAIILVAALIGTYVVGLIASTL